MRYSHWKTYLVAATALVGAFFVIPGDGWLRPVCGEVITLVAVAGIVLGVRRYRPAGGAAWLLFASGVFMNGTGTLVEAVENHVSAEHYPMVADVFWLGLYPGLVLGMALLIRRRTAGRDWATLVDATTVSTGLGLLSWVFVIKPSVGDTSLSLLGQVTVIAYPVFDVVVLAMMIRLLLGAGSHNPSFRLVSASLLAFLGGDVAWAVIWQFGWTPGPHTERALGMVFLTAYVLFGAAALHPSVREVGEQAGPRLPRLSLPSLALLTSASLIAPAILAVQVARHQVTDGVAIVVGSVALFLLVVTRMAQLLNRVEGQAKQLLDLARVDELTGLPNRRAWSVELPAAIERARRDGVPLSVAMIDLDFFKRFNDEYGHPAGDRLLRGAAAAWREQLRAVDQLARYGGEEFIVLLPAADSDLGEAVLERLRAATPAGQTFSAGLATWDGAETSDELIARADRALYAAKNAGRDRTMVAPLTLDPGTRELAAS
jgi:diguanylate cyclase (GGDEF)-like protein